MPLSRKLHRNFNTALKKYKNVMYTRSFKDQNLICDMFYDGMLKSKFQCEIDIIRHNHIPLFLSAEGNV